jgi:hypothetical protein
LLRKVQVKKRNEEPKASRHEEWQAGNSGSLSCVRPKDVQDRQIIRKQSSKLAEITVLIASNGTLAAAPQDIRRPAFPDELFIRCRDSACRRRRLLLTAPNNLIFGGDEDYV